MEFLSVITLAFTLGMGCGSCCGSLTAMFLSSYIISEGGSTKSSIFKVLSFFGGKISGIVIVCVFCSVIGTSILSDLDEAIDTDLLSPLVILGISLYLLTSSIVKMKRKKCTCSAEVNSKLRGMPLYIAGFIYGITPCAPLITICTYSVTLDVFSAVILAIVFALASSLLPTLLASGLSTLLAGKIKSQLGEMLPVFRITVYVIVIIVSATMLLTELNLPN